MLCSSWAIACACASLQYLIASISLSALLAVTARVLTTTLPVLRLLQLSVSYPQSFHSYPCIGLVHLARETSTLRHYLLTGIRVTESCTPLAGPRPMPPSAILISHTYTNVPFSLFITCSSFKSSFELNLTLLEHCANTITKLWLLDTMQGFGSHHDAHHAHALFLKARLGLRNLRGYSSPSASRSGLLVKSIPTRMRLKLEDVIILSF